MLDNTKAYVEKMHTVGAELTGHTHKFDIKLRKLFGSGFPLNAVQKLTKCHHFDGTIMKQAPAWQQACEEYACLAPLSSFCNDSNLHISVFQ